MEEGFIQMRRGLFEHVRDGRLTQREFGFYVALLFLVKAETGIWHGCSEALKAHFGSGDATVRQAKEALSNLEKQGYIRRFRTHGQRGNYPILIDKYLITSGVLSGKVVNASESTSSKNVKYEARTDSVPDTVRDTAPETVPDTVPYNKTETETKTVSKSGPAASACVTDTKHPVATLVDITAADDATRLARLMYYKVLGFPKEAPVKTAMFARLRRDAESLLSNHSFELAKNILKYAKGDPFWFGLLTKPETKYPMALFAKSFDSIASQMEGADRPKVQSTATTTSTTKANDAQEAAAAAMFSKWGAK
jgi:hypothetical protein